MNRIANVFAVAALSLVPAFSAVRVEEQKAAKADAVRSETIFSNGVPVNGVLACTSCHDTDGSSAMNVNPRLVGQHAEYVEKQLKDFEAKTDRNHPVMSLCTGALSDQDMKDIGAYLGGQPARKSGSAKSKNMIGLDQKLYRDGSAKRGIAACTGCYGLMGVDIPAQYLHIAGQFSEYTEAQLMVFQSDARKSSVQTHDLAGRMTAQQIKAVANYTAGLHQSAASGYHVTAT